MFLCPRTIPSPTVPERERESAQERADDEKHNVRLMGGWASGWADGACTPKRCVAHSVWWLAASVAAAAVTTATRSPNAFALLASLCGSNLLLLAGGSKDGHEPCSGGNHVPVTTPIPVARSLARLLARAPPSYAAISSKISPPLQQCLCACVRAETGGWKGWWCCLRLFRSARYNNIVVHFGLQPTDSGRRQRRRR